MSVKVRFAPSPTGYLHVGNIRTALVNWLFTRNRGGTFLLRIDDTDEERSKPQFAHAIEEDLNWLGLAWDELAHQSARRAAYEKAKERLIAAGRLYPCYETPEELEVRRKFQTSRGLPPVYDRGALKLTETDKKAREAEGRKAHWRFLLEDKDTAWHDLVRGDVKFAPGHLSDPVLLREDGVPTYTLASVVDDAEMGITHILRGEDHVSNTAVQVQLFEALGAGVPAFGHFALLKTREGGLSKREGGGDIRGLRERGIMPMAMASLLAKLGTSDAVEPKGSLEQLAREFDIAKFGRAPATYDEAELLRLNAKLLSEMPYPEAAPLLRILDLEHITPDFWQAMHANFETLRDTEAWWNILHNAIEPVKENPELMKKAVELLPTEWTPEAFKAWFKAISDATGSKGKALYHPLRLGLTAREDGPDLATLLALLGREKTEARLKACAG